MITGAGSGIGAALAARFAAESPRSLILVDLAEASVEQVAVTLRDAQADTAGVLGAAEFAVEHAACDVADGAAVTGLVERIRADHGEIDLFVGNAGIATGLGVEADDATWQRIWDVNVMAHVHASRALLPGWLERGAGYLLITASAAGLLTNLGDAPYSVTKHGAVALAEWLSVTYGDRGLRVSCLCPQGVRTPLLFGGDQDGELAAEVVKAQRILEPEEVAEVTLDALRREQFLILPHSEVADYERARAADRERWLGAMRGLQRRMTGGADRPGS